MIDAIIPARGGSKTIPRKNIVNIGGYPLLAYSIAACKMSKNISNIYVSTEDEEIANIAKKYGAKVPFMRPKDLSQDHSTDVGFLAHFFNNVEVKEVALIRPTTPFRDPRFMDSVIAEFYSIDKEITGLRTVNEISENPYKVLSGTTFGNKIYAKVCEKVIDIDTPFDLKIARLQVGLGNKLLNYLKGEHNE